MKIRYQKKGFDLEETVGEEIGIMDDDNVILLKFYETTDGYLMSYSSNRVKIMNEGGMKNVKVSKENVVSS